LKKRNIYTAVFVISILGLVIIQYQYLKIGLNLAKVQFDRKMALASESIERDLSTKNQLTFLMGSALMKDNSFFTTSIDNVKDASSHFLDDFIKVRLVNHGIDTDFSYVMHTRDTTYYLHSPSIFKDEENMATYPIELSGYLPDLVDKRLLLELKFKNLNSYFLSQINGLTLPGIIFLIGILATVIWVLKTYYWQRNLIVNTTEFIDNLTHELKTPVFSISLATKILEKNVTPEQKPVISIIQQEVKRLSGHIDKVLELGRLESNKEIFKLEKVDFRPFLQQLCEEFKTLISIEEVSFSYDLEPGKYVIKAEIFHLENAVNNLLDNAKKYADDPSIVLEATKKKGKLEITVADNGKGIDAKEKHRIFQKYYRITDGDLYKVKGYGLGLSYVKKVVDKHRGKVHIESKKDRGTKITISIPTCNES
jgi:two-component system phosphate regulon sensor histidine kinase PhoR